MRLSMAAAALCAGSVAVSVASAEVAFFDFLLDNAQEVPGGGMTSDAFGFATLAYDRAAMTFDLQVFTDGIALEDLRPVGANGSPIHIHAAPAGANGPIVIDLGLVGAFNDEGGGVLSFTAFGVAIGEPQGAGPASDPIENERALFAGGLYLNIHTLDFPGGEIRGQIVPAPMGAGVLAAGALVAARRRRA